MHGREHERWNEAFFSEIPAARAIEARAARRLKRLEKWLPASTNLAMTIGAEHITAILGDLMLRDEEFLNGRQHRGKSQPAYVTMLRWHGLEEIEHKAVAFDVWKQVMQGKLRAYPERCLGLLLILAAYWSDINAMIGASLRAQTIDYAVEIPSLKSYLRGTNGVLRKIAGPLLS